jgi:membrane protease YdiL (CAAX protease family)
MKKYFKALGFILIYLAFYYMMQVVVLLLISVFVSLAFGYGEQEARGVLMDCAVYILLVSACVSYSVYVFICRKRDRRLLPTCGFNAGVSAKSLICGGLFGFSVNYIISIALVFIQESGLFERAFERHQEVTSTLTQGSFLPSLLIVGIVIPIFEEVMFRGLIYRELEEILPPTVVIITQGLLFGVYHGQIVQGVYASLLGIYLGYIVYKTKNIWPAIFAHIAMNSISVLSTLPLVSNLIKSYAALFMLFVAISFIFSIRHFSKLAPITKPDRYDPNVA